MKLPWAILVLASVFPTLGALVYFVVAEPGPLLRVTYTTAKIVQFAFPLLFLWWWNRPRLLAVRFSWRGTGFGLAFGALLFLTIFGAYFLYFRAGPLFAQVGSAVREKVAGLGLDTPWLFLVLACFISFAHSFLEEYYWRWFVHAGYRERLPQSWAIAFSSLAFAAHHVIVLDIYFHGQFWVATLPFTLAVILGGAIWAWWYDRAGSLAGTWLSHIAADLALMGIGYDLLYR